MNGGEIGLTRLDLAVLIVASLIALASWRLRRWSRG